MYDNYKGIAVVTGSSSGIGFETSLALARLGFLTCATMRDIKKSKEIEITAKKENIPIKVFEIDVNSEKSIKEGIAKIVDEHGQIDILVNNAGYGVFGALEDISIDEIKNQFETNVFGVIRMIQNVVPIMRKKNNGIIINVTSLAGLIGVPAESVYASTKFAVEGLSESLSYELEPFGIKIVLVEPGVINTEFVRDLIIPTNRYGINKNGERTTNRKLSNASESSGLSPYNTTIEKFLAFYYNAMDRAPHPKIVADEIIKVLETGYRGTNFLPLVRIPVGVDSRKYIKFKKELSDNDFHKLIIEGILK